jgi:hypothetical protein
MSRPIVELLEALCCTFLILSAFYPATANLQGFIAYQVGAWGDEASIGNLGVQAEIRTNVYNFEAANTASSRHDDFYVGSILTNGAFIQFGYALQQGRYCLRGYLLHGNFTCTSLTQLIPSGDVRWEWQYWPLLNGTDVYGEIGPFNSASSNGTWHTYSIVATSNDSWGFFFDGGQISSVSLPASPSDSSVFVVAEQVTATSLARLGPVQFRNVSYLTLNHWQPVKELRALVGCGINMPCTLPNPYGVSVLGPDYIAAGTGMEKYQNGEVLWSETYRPMSTISSILMRSTAIIAIVVLVVLIAIVVQIRRESKKAQPRPEELLWTCVECGARMEQAAKFCTNCGTKRPQ